MRTSLRYASSKLLLLVRLRKPAIQLCISTRSDVSILILIFASTFVVLKLQTSNSFLPDARCQDHGLGYGILKVDFCESLSLF